MSTVGVPGDALEWLARERSTVRDAALEEAAQAIEAVTKRNNPRQPWLSIHAARIVRDLKGERDE